MLNDHGQDLDWTFDAIVDEVFVQEVRRQRERGCAQGVLLGKQRVEGDA